MFNRKRRTVRSITTVFIASVAMMAPTAGADAALFGTSSNYLVRITPAAQAAAESAIKTAGGQVNARFQYAFNGFVIKLPDALVPVLKKIPNILTVEKDMPVSGIAIQQNQMPTPSWGLDRIDQREAVSTLTGYQGSYGYRSAGSGATVYIGDTGVYPHNDLAGRLSANGYSGISDGNGTVDCNGHGTHVATTAAGSKYGIAKNATVVPVRILDCTGRGTYATVIAGLDWILSPLNTNPKTQAVVNLSIGGGASTSINDAILKLTNSGITVVAAAGNDNIDACQASPASAPSAITVGATTIGDAKAGFSNWGSCVDINAPGVGITGGWINNADATNTISGTSMATPHVTGAVAVYLGLNPTASVAQVTQGILDQSTAGAVVGLNATTPNKMLYVSPTDGGPAIVAPAVQVKTVSRVSHEDADVVVEVNPGNASTTAQLQYSTDQNFATDVVTKDLTPTALIGGDVISIPLTIETLTASSTYYIRATATNESGSFTTPIGTFKTIAPPVSAPRPVATTATLVTGWSARLTGTVNAMNGSTNVFFVYGTDPDFLVNTKTGAASPATVAGAKDSLVSLDISFLQGSTTYYYKVVAGNSVASVESSAQSFTTAEVVGVAPTVETIRPTGGLNTPTTSITGRVNPQGQTTSVRLVYGVEQSLTLNPKIINLPLQYTGTDTVTVTADMINLIPGYRYYYRFEAINAAGHTKITPLTNVGNPVMPVVLNTYANSLTKESMQLVASVNAGAGNLRFSFIYGTDPKLETGTTIINATPFAITDAINRTIVAPIAGLQPATTYYFRVKMLAYTGPLQAIGGIAYGPIVKQDTLYPPRLAQSITFNLPTSRYYGGAPTPLTATASSGLPVTFSVSTPAICRVETVDSQSVLTYVTPLQTSNSSTCGVVASQIGDYTNAPAASVVRGIVFTKETTGIRATWAGPLNETGTALDLLIASTSQPALNEQLAGTTALTVTSRTPRVCVVDSSTYQGSSTSHTQAIVRALWNGTCQLQVTFNGASYWLASSTTVSLVVSGMKTPQTGANAYQYIDYSLPATATFGYANPLIARSTSGLPITMTSMTPAICSLTTLSNGNFAAVSADGLAGDNNMCSVKVEQAGDLAWAAAAPITLSFNFVRKSQSITFTAPGARYIGGAPTVLTGTSTSGLPVTFATTTPTVCTVTVGETQTTLSLVSIPTTSSVNCTISAIQLGNDQYRPSASNVRTMTWMKEPTGIKWKVNAPISVAGVTADFTVYSLTQSLLGELNGGTSPLTITSATPNICRVSNPTYIGSATSHTQVTISALWNGTCRLTASFAGNTYWLPSSTIFAATVSGLTSPQPGANAAQFIGFGSISNRDYGSSYQLSAVATSKLPVAYTSLTPTSCVITQLSNGSSVIQAAPGTGGVGQICSVQASRAGNELWAPAVSVTRSFTWIKPATVIRVISPYSSRSGVGPFTVTASSSYLNTSLNAGAPSVGLPVTVTTSTPAACQILTVAPTTVGTGIYTQVTIKGLTNAVCSTTWTFAGDQNRTASTAQYNFTISGIK